MRLIGYSRVSTEEQATNGHNVELWPEKFRLYCELHGHELVSTHIDTGISRSKPFLRRPHSDFIMQQLEQDRADGILIPDLDRMFGLTLDGLLFTFEKLEPMSKCLLSINDHIDTSTPIGKFMFTVNLARCQLDRDKIAFRTQETMQALKEAGRAFGHAPFGFVGVEGQLYQHPENHLHRDYIFELRDAGCSLRSICGELEADKVPTPGSGRHWHASTVRNILESRHEFDHIPPLPEGVDTRVSVTHQHDNNNKVTHT